MDLLAQMTGGSPLNSFVSRLIGKFEPDFLFRKA